MILSAGKSLETVALFAARPAETVTAVFSAIPIAYRPTGLPPQGALQFGGATTGSFRLTQAKRKTEARRWKIAERKHGACERRPDKWKTGSIRSKSSATF